MSNDPRRRRVAVGRRSRFSAPVSPGPAGDLPWSGFITLVNLALEYRASSVTDPTHWSTPYPTVEGGVPGVTCIINRLKGTNRADLTITGGLNSSQFFDELGAPITVVEAVWNGGIAIQMSRNSGVRYRSTNTALITYLDGLNIPLDGSMVMPLTLTKVS